MRRIPALLLTGTLGAVGLAATNTAVASPSAVRAAAADADHDFGTMTDPYAAGRTRLLPSGARVAWSARTVNVSPSSGPDFELPFRCGETWAGSTRSSHSPSRHSIDFNRADDTGRPALASARGVVTRVATAGGYGTYVIVDHGRGYSTLYAHLQAAGVAVGQVVDQGAVVGYVGSSGRVTGPHLHFEQRLNGDYFAPYFHRTRFAYNRTVASSNCPDVPVSGDWDGNGRDDVGVFRPTASGGGHFDTTTDLGKSTRRTAFGRAGSMAAIGDWDGNGVDQFAMRYPRSVAFQLRGQDGRVSQANMGGSSIDVPLGGRWAGGAKSGIGVYQPGRRAFVLRLPNLTKQTISMGGTGLQPVTGDWDGNGTTDVGTFDSRTGAWVLRSVRSGKVTLTRLTYGSNGDIPVPGDWNGDRVTDVGVWRPSTGTFLRRTVTAPNSPRQSASYSSVRYGAPRR